MDIKIRPAALTELDTLLAFEQGIIQAERPYDETLRPDPISYYDLEKLIESDDAQVVVAHVEDTLVGSGFARIDQSKPYLTHLKHAYLGFMYVEPAHRGKGINQMIMEALSDWAREKGISEMKLDVYSENQAAIRAYEKAGFKKNLVEMRMDIS